MSIAAAVFVRQVATAYGLNNYVNVKSPPDLPAAAMESSFKIYFTKLPALGNRCAYALRLDRQQGPATLG
jgi:hypothetical protein